jgi:tetrapyrrole methylase family protein/MazG family protein
MSKQASVSFAALIDVIKALRAPDGCPWDKEQTHRSLAPYAIEEAHELAEAIENGSRPELMSELGDVLLQVMLHSEIARQSGQFDIFDVVQTLHDKMIRRHPHVFGPSKVPNNATDDVTRKEFGKTISTDEVLANWDEIKKLEKESRPAPSQERFEVPLSLPALTRAAKIGSKSKAHRFDWTTVQGVLNKVDEEIAELKEAVLEGDLGHQEHELGDVFFSLAQLARHLKLEPEQTLRAANQRFERRFFKMKKMIQDNNENYDSLSAEQLEDYWRKVKVAEKSSLTSATLNSHPKAK